jgi:hypothetical protein
MFLEELLKDLKDLMELNSKLNLRMLNSKVSNSSQHQGQQLEL